MSGRKKLIPNSELQPIMDPPKQRTGGQYDAFMWDNEKLKRVFEYAANGLLDRQIAAMFGLSHITFSVHKGKYPALREALEKGLASTMDKIGKAVVKKAVKGSYLHSKLFAEARGGWSPNEIKNQTPQINIAGNGITINFVEGEKTEKLGQGDVIEEQQGEKS